MATEKLLSTQAEAMVQDSSISSSPKANSRGKYISKACIPCRLSKSKCAGGLVCQNCRRHNKVCTYPIRARVRKQNPQTSVKDSHPARQVGPIGLIGNEEDRVMERLKCLEQHISRMDRVLQSELAGQKFIDDDEKEIGANLDREIFKVASNREANASLSSHIYALKESLLPTTKYMQQTSSLLYEGLIYEEELGKAKYFCTLPSLSEINRLVSLYFDHLHIFFPCIDAAEFRERLDRIVGGQVSENGQISVLVKPCSRIFSMVMCMVLAVATYLDPSSHYEKGTSTPGWQYFLMAKEIAGKDHFLRWESIDLDLIRYHTVNAIYMIHIERLTAASQSISTAIQLAFHIGLNDELTWNRYPEGNQRARRLLWWTIFYVDRRVAQKCWKPYLIRENEVQVRDFETLGSATSHTVLDTETYSEEEADILISRYVQTQVIWARLWALVWDSLFAARASKGESRSEEVEMLDARILHNQRRIHQSLPWETSALPTYVTAGETEVHIRSKLVASVRMNLLRLLIRQSWKHTTASDPRDAHICKQLASETIEAIIAFMDSRANPIPFGLNAVECVVEAMCHLVPHLQNLPPQEFNPPLSSFGRAIEFLQNISSVLGSARRALNTLGGIADKGWQDVLVPNQDTTLDYMAASLSNPQISGQESLHDLFLSEWSEICLPLPEIEPFE